MSFGRDRLDYSFFPCQHQEQFVFRMRADLSVLPLSTRKIRSTLTLFVPNERRATSAKRLSQ